MSKTKNQVLVIDRTRWLRGVYGNPTGHVQSDGDTSKLYRKHDRRMCCLGFYLRSCGCKVGDIIGRSKPNDLDALPNQAHWLVQKWGEQDYLINKNDNTYMSDEVREKEITAVFARNGVTVKFTGPRLPKVNGKEVRYEHVNKKSKPKDG